MVTVPCMVRWQAVETPDGDGAPPGEYFVADVTEVVVTGLDDRASVLVVTWWTPDDGLQRVERG